MIYTFDFDKTSANIFSKTFNVGRRNITKANYIPAIASLIPLLKPLWLYYCTQIQDFIIVPKLKTLLQYQSSRLSHYTHRSAFFILDTQIETSLK